MQHVREPLERFVLGQGDAALVDRKVLDEVLNGHFARIGDLFEKGKVDLHGWLQ